jgi:hypothetical protein
VVNKVLEFFLILASQNSSGVYAMRTALALLLMSAAGALAQTERFELPAEQRTGSIQRIFVLPHSHLDIGFTLPPDQVARDYKDSIDIAIRLALENGDFRWTIESAWMLGEWLRRTEDERLIEDLGRLMQEGRISLGVAFGNMHSGLMDTEEMNRLVYLGESFRRRFGIRSEVAFQNDVPGFSWAYPRVLAGSGVKYLVTGLNLFIGGGNNFGMRHTPFYWIGPDGSRILTWFTYDSYVEGLTTQFRIAEAVVANTVETPSGVKLNLSDFNLKPWQSLTTLVRLQR